MRRRTSQEPTPLDGIIVFGNKLVDSPLPGSSGSARQGSFTRVEKPSSQAFEVFVAGIARQAGTRSRAAPAGPLPPDILELSLQSGLSVDPYDGDVSYSGSSFPARQHVSLTTGYSERCERQA